MSDSTNEDVAIGPRVDGQSEPEHVPSQQEGARDETPIEQSPESQEPVEESVDRATRVGDEQAREATQVPPEPEPTEPPTLVVQVIPSDGVKLLVDDRRETLDTELSLSRGQHDIVVISPEFPVFERMIELDSDTGLSFNLPEVFGSAESFTLSISTVPRLKNKNLRVWFNGRYTDCSGGKARRVKKQLGSWLMRFDIVEKDGGPGAVAIDSFRVDPGPEGTVGVYVGNESQVDYRALDLRSGKHCKIVVYRSGD